MVTKSDFVIDGWHVKTMRQAFFVSRERRLSKTIANAERATKIRLRA